MFDDVLHGNGKGKEGVEHVPAAPGATGSKWVIFIHSIFSPYAA